MTGAQSDRIQEPSWDECMKMLDRLPSLPTEERVELIEQLLRNSSPAIRETALRTGAVVVPDDRLENYLRSDADDVLRCAGLEMLKLRGPRAVPLAVPLLKDEDPDVVLQAVLALGHIQDVRALEPLRASLGHPDPNVVQAAIEAVGKLGDARAIPDLLQFLDADPWLQMAAIQALGDLRSPAAVAPLAQLLTDLGAGALAAEAVARIGGAAAFRTLAQHWMRFKEDLDPEATLALLAHVLEGLSRPPREVAGLRSSLCAVLEAPEDGSRVAAARCLLALGPGPEDLDALTVLATDHDEFELLPACLAKRKDLIQILLNRPGKLCAWGLLLSAHYPESATVKDLGQAIAREGADMDIRGSLAKALSVIQHPDLAEELFALYLRLPSQDRHALSPLIETHSNHIRALLDQRNDLDAETRVTLSAQLGYSPEEVVASIVDLEPDIRVRVLDQVAGQEVIARSLPWADWIREQPELHASVAAETAAGHGLRELLPLLRELLVTNPNPALVRAMGELRDRDSVPRLLALLEDPRATKLKPLLLESLGRIGGPEARRALRRAISETSDEPRIAYRALSLCAIEQDDAVFRQALSHGDWYVRLTCAEVLGRFRRPENLAALSQLAADPVAIVSQRALSILGT